MYSLLTVPDTVNIFLFSHLTLNDNPMRKAHVFSEKKMGLNRVAICPNTQK